MSDYGCPLAYLQNMVDADALPVEVLNALKEEIKELKEELEDVKEEYWEKGWNTGKCDTWDEIDKTVKPLKEEIKELKLERERDTIAEVRSARDRALSENKKLKAKFEKFKEVLTQE